MNGHEPTPFDTVEGAHEYLGLLLEAVLDAKREIESDIKAMEDPQYPRRLEALRLVMFKLEKLEQHVKSGGRLLNDLRTLRRLLLEGRGETAGPGAHQAP